MSISRMVVEEALVRACGNADVIKPRRDLIASGLLDSLAIINLFNELELLGVEAYPTQIKDSDLRTVDTIIDFLERENKR